MRLARGPRPTGNAPPARDYESLAQATLSGSFWISAQAYANKALAAGALVLLSFLLTPEDYGVANTALAAAAFLNVLHAQTVGDVLIARPGRLPLLAATAERLAIALGLIGMALTLLAIPIALRVYDAFPPLMLAGLLALLAARLPFAGLGAVPLTQLRQRLAFRRIAAIDGCLQCAATALAVGFAALGGKATALVAPQAISHAARSLSYLRAGQVPGRRRYHRGLLRPLLKSYWPACGAQYVHSALIMAEIVVLGVVVDQYEVGLFAFSFWLAIQFNAVLAVNTGMVVQSTLGHLRREPGRQIDGLLRTLRVLAALCIPIAVLQFSFAEPFFRLILADKWQAAIPIFQALSLQQAFSFAAGPCMACLKSQGRFGALLAWQGMQLLLSLPIFWFGARQAGALGVAVASCLVWASSATIGIWLCTRFDANRRLRQVARLFVRPWLGALPAGLAAYSLVAWLGAGYGAVGELLALAVLAPLTLAVLLLLARALDDEFAQLLDSTVRSATAWLGRTLDRGRQRR